MARIPAGEEFGQVVARPQQAPGIVPGANGEAIGRAVQGFGQDLMQIEARQAQEEKRLRDAADRAQTEMALQKGADAMDALVDEFGEGIQSGTIDKKQAGQLWGERSKQLGTDALQSVPEAYRSLAQMKLDGHAASLSRGVRRAVVARDQSDTWAGVMQTSETARRLANTNPQKADELMNMTLEQQGPFTGKSSAELQVFHQNWKEGVAQSRAASMIQDARNNNGQLDTVMRRMGSEEFSNLTPEALNTLTARAEGFKTSNIQRAEAARARAEAQQRARLEHAQAAYNAAQGIVATGKSLSPEYVEQLTKATSGTPFSQALPSLLKQAPEQSAFGMQPLAVQRQALSDLRAKLNQDGTSPEMEKQVKNLETIYQQSVKDYGDDALLAAQERGILQSVTPIDTSSIQSIVQGLGSRIEQANTVRGVVGHPVSPLLKDEAQSVANLLNSLPVEQQSSAVEQFKKVAGADVASAIARQIAPKDEVLAAAIGAAGQSTNVTTSYLFGSIGGGTTTGRNVSEIILKGGHALRNDLVKKDEAKVTGDRASIASAIGDAYTNPQVRDQAINAALYVKYGLMAEGSPSGNDKAVQLATGGVIDFNGKKVPLPWGMTEDQFTAKMKSQAPRSLGGQLPDEVYVGRTPLRGADLANKLPSSALIDAGPGRYAISAGGGLVTDKNGRPVVLEIKP